MKLILNNKTTINSYEFYHNKKYINTIKTTEFTFYETNPHWRTIKVSNGYPTFKINNYHLLFPYMQFAFKDTTIHNRKRTQLIITASTTPYPSPNIKFIPFLRNSCLGNYNLAELSHKESIELFWNTRFVNNSNEKFNLLLELTNLYRHNVWNHPSKLTNPSMFQLHETTTP